MLATSREALQLQAEELYAVAPLPVPEDGVPETVARAAAGDRDGLQYLYERVADPRLRIKEQRPGLIGRLLRPRSST